MIILNFNKLLLLILFIGILMFVYYLSKNSVVCPTPPIMYKYIPRNFTYDSEYPDNVSEVFKKMFDKQSENLDIHSK